MQWAQSMRHLSRLENLASHGIPARLRSQVWSIAIGNRLNLDDQSLSFFFPRADQSLIGGCVLDEFTF